VWHVEPSRCPKQSAAGTLLKAAAAAAAAVVAAAEFSCHLVWKRPPAPAW